MKKIIIVGAAVVQMLVSYGEGNSANAKQDNQSKAIVKNVAQGQEYVGRGLAYQEQIRVGENVGLMVARARLEFMLALTVDPRNSEAYYQLGCLYRDSFGYKEYALDQFEMFARLSDKFDERRRQVQEKVLPELREKVRMSAAELSGSASRDPAKCAVELGLADKCMKGKNVSGARRHYTMAYVADPLSFDAALGLARALESGGQEEIAVMYYRTACRIKPYSVDALVATGKLALKQGMFATAADAFSRALAVSPKNRVALESLMTVLHKLNREEEAKAYCLYSAKLQDVVKP